LLGNRQYCYPLTVTDHASRFPLTCEALSSTREDYAFTVFERLFKERGLPANIRSDNGVPFASAHALLNLSRLAVWWLRLGIGIERWLWASPNPRFAQFSIWTTAGTLGTWGFPSRATTANKVRKLISLCAPVDSGEHRKFTCDGCELSACWARS
jgi:hypothetical protein